MEKSAGENALIPLVRGKVFLKCSGRLPVALLKYPVEGAEAVKTAGVTDIGDGKVRVRQKPHGVFGAEAIDII